jgi:hypothetical protein
MDFEPAAERKLRRVIQRRAALHGAWGALGNALQTKHATLLRRDIQRYSLLHEGKAVPPTAMLDIEWRSAVDAGEALERLPLAAGLGLCSSRDIGARMLETSSLPFAAPEV